MEKDKGAEKSIYLEPPSRVQPPNPVLYQLIP